ncbi:BON domain-containing protein [Ramlibacter tataouinensis]|uniref:BON domain-containing protein n=1 Tax=Ramlibacter tataouinensis TaxID=94132 RepID=UPI0002D78DD6|nr:BON domain-containing protein [Ramlibacter tataouinensis]
MSIFHLLSAALVGVLVACEATAAAPVRGRATGLCPSGEARFWRDQALTVRLAGQLQMHQPLRRERIEVQVRGGVVLLSGSVSSPRQQRAAAQLAARVEGVRCVQNFMRVGPPRSR